MSRLNYHHLYYFWRVAVDGNLTRVARALHVSQSALSAQIKQLEERMQTQLFERKGRALLLTERGRQVLDYANDIFLCGEELEQLFLRGTEPERQLLRIGVLSTMSRNFVDGFIAPLLENPKVTFSLHAHGLTNLLNRLTSHHLDLILTNTEVRTDEDSPWQTQLLARQTVSIVGPPERKLGPDFPDAFAGLRWVLPGRRSTIRGAFDALCAIHQFEPDIQAEADDMAMLRLLARDSGALAVLPPVVVQDELKMGSLEEYMVLPRVYENFYAITVKRRYPRALIAELIHKASDTEAPD